jgi:hypothetical protein
MSLACLCMVAAALIARFLKVEGLVDEGPQGPELRGPARAGG